MILTHTPKSPELLCKFKEWLSLRYLIKLKKSLIVTPEIMFGLFKKKHRCYRDIRINEIRVWRRWMLHTELCSCSSMVQGEQRCTDWCSWVPSSLQEGFSCKCYCLALLDSNQIWEQPWMSCCLLNSQPLLCPIPQLPRSIRLLMSELSQPLDMPYMGPALLVLISYIFAKVSWEIQGLKGLHHAY